LDCLPQHRNSRCALRRGQLPEMRHRARHEIPRIEILDRPAFSADSLSSKKFRFDRGDDAGGDLVLQCEYVAELAVVSLRPYMLVRCRVNELAGNANPLAALPEAALEHVANTKLPSQMLHIHRFALVSEGRVAGNDEEPVQSGQRRDDVLSDSVAEVLLLGITRHVGERQYGNRGLVRQRECGLSGWRRLADTRRSNPEDVARPRDVLELPLAQILEGQIQLVAHLIVHDLAYADPAGFGEAFEPCRNVDAIAVNIVAVDDDVAEVDAEAELDAMVRRHVRVASLHRVLDLDRALDGSDHAREFDQEAIASCLDDAAVVLGDLRVDQ